MGGGAREVHICEGPEALATAAAAYWAAAADAAIRERGEFHVALAGGSTPRSLYALLATPAWREKLPWSATHVWFGDERCVPPDHPDSNFRMAHEALLSRIDGLAARTHRMEGEREPAEAARDYGRALRNAVPPGDAPEAPPRLDLVLLGLGPDGHIASLFPETPLLEERASLAGAVFVPKLDAWRISLTYPVIEAARHVAILASGRGKSAIIAEAFGSEAERYPVGRLHPRGDFDWFIDTEAAARLPRREAAS